MVLFTHPAGDEYTLGMNASTVKITLLFILILSPDGCFIFFFAL